MTIYLKTSKEIDIMDDANCIVHDVLNLIQSNLCEGVTTRFLDSLAEKAIYDAGGTPSFKNYKGYPSSICASVNEEVVHGIPNDRELKDGDIITIDIGVNYNGFVGDAARTFIIGSVNKKIKKLVEDTKDALYSSIEEMVIGNRLNDISKCLYSIASKNKYGNVVNFCGHGVGRSMHESPNVFNYIHPNEPNIRLQNGIVLAIEPMFTLGSSIAIIQNDGWTAITEDKSIACHWELSVALEDGKPRILGRKSIK